MSIQGVYETGPLKGLPLRGRPADAGNVFAAAALEAIRQNPPPVSPHDATRLRLPTAADLRDGFHAYTYAGDPALTDEAIDNAGDVDVEWSAEERGLTGVACLVFIACAVAYFGLRILGVF